MKIVLKRNKLTSKPAQSFLSDRLSFDGGDSDASNFSDPELDPNNLNKSSKKRRKNSDSSEESARGKAVTEINKPMHNVKVLRRRKLIIDPSGKENGDWEDWPAMKKFQNKASRVNMPISDVKSVAPGFRKVVAKKKETKVQLTVQCKSRIFKLYSQSKSAK